MARGDLVRGFTRDGGRLVALVRRARGLRVAACIGVVGSRFSHAVLTKRTLHHAGFSLGRSRNAAFLGGDSNSFAATTFAAPTGATATTAASAAATALTTRGGFAHLATDCLFISRDDRRR